MNEWSKDTHFTLGIKKRREVKTCLIDCLSIPNMVNKYPKFQRNF